MNRRGFFRLMAGASAVALAPALLARPDYTKGQTYTFNAAPIGVRMTLQLDGGPVRKMRLVAHASRDEKTWRKVAEGPVDHPVSFKDVESDEVFLRLTWEPVEPTEPRFVLTHWGVGDRGPEII